MTTATGESSRMPILMRSSKVSSSGVKKARKQSAPPIVDRSMTMRSADASLGTQNSVAGINPSSVDGRGVKP